MPGFKLNYLKFAIKIICFEHKIKKLLPNQVNVFLIIINVRKLSSRLEYFLQIFTAEFVLILQMVVLDTELNSASNGDIFKRGSSGKNGGFRPKYCFFKNILGFFHYFSSYKLFNFVFHLFCIPK